MNELLGCALLGGVAAMIACTTTASSVASSVVTTYAPVTSIEVGADQLFERIGCGANAGQAYKYVTVVYEAGPDGLRIKDTPDAIAVTDCWTDALFQNLSSSELFAASAYFSLSVYVFDEPTYDLVEPEVKFESLQVTDFTVDEDAGTLGGRGAQVATDALYTTACTAQQLPEVESIAACDALQD